ncbi:MAG: hypothetical protein K6G87_07770 [Butyrivibrio sp.]|uniref:DUF5696 domain-containing protein n=1 Tax=Butyrivibrio sp. TaxID=28121 RepID=UPI0025CDD713|nr:DUF5696 domain-containing protein [Butyrivibrio sp.]MCR5771109.1 hypothetical protein [Butyrivibrio sp.]
MKKELTERQVERRNAIKETLKSMIAPLIFLCIIGAIVFVVVTYQNAEVAPEIIEPNAYTEIEGPVVIENDSLKLTMDPETTQFELLVKSSGKVWKSVPDGSEEDAIALPEEKAKLMSTLVMSFNTEAGLETTYDSYNYSVKNKIYEVIPGDDQIEVKYSLGQVEKEYVIPPVCTAEDYEKWTGAMSKEGLNVVGEYYKKYDINDLGKKDNKEELLANYPIIETNVIYVLRSTTKENVKKTLQKYFEEAGYTYENYLADKELDLTESVSDKPVFNVNVIYKLEGDELVVEVPLSELEYKSDYPIYTISVLPFFGAGSKDDQGFMMVPEGGGAIINFNNGKTTQNSYYANVYGWDMCLSRKALVHNTRASFGVYGISQGDDSFICMLEDGRSYASIQADISGKNNSYNYVNAVYSICQREQYEVGDIANSEIYKYIEELPDENLTQRYKFVDSGSYVDMAKGYGSYLKDKYGDYMALNTDTEAPVEVEIVGAVDKVKQIVGVPVSRPLALTTYEEAQGIIQDLNSQGFNNMSIKMSGWCNGGVSQKLLDDVNLIGSLGGKKDLTALSDYASQNGVDLYLNGVTQYEYNSNIFDGFFSYRDAAKLINKERAELYQYSAVTYAQREGAKTYFLLHTELAQKMADNLINAATTYGTGVSFEDNGKDLSADYYVKNPYSREAVLKLQEQTFKATNDNGQNVMINMGNDYAVPYANMVTNMDLRGNDYTILDECIPFYQLAIHGYVDYTGYSLNICGDDVQQLLYSAEYGAGLSFTVMKESSFALQKTLYTEYYGSDYDAWRDRMIEYYTRYNEELGHIFNQEMVDHKNITDTLSVTTYADGTKVYVNYDFEDVTADGQTIPARDYLVVRS